MRRVDAATTLGKTSQFIPPWIVGFENGLKTKQKMVSNPQTNESFSDIVEKSSLSLGLKESIGEIHLALKYIKKKTYVTSYK